MLAALPTAGQTAVPPGVEAAIVGRLLAGDRALPQRASGNLGIGLLFKAGQGASTNLAVIEAYQGLKSQSIQGLTPTTGARAFRDLADLEDWLGREHVVLLRVGDGLADQLAALGGVCDRRRIVCLGTGRDHLKNGFAVAVTMRDARPLLQVHLAHAARQGLDLAPEVIRLSEVVR
jgi:hypothetical protein